MHCVRHPERRPTVAARAAERDPETARAQCAVHDAFIAGAVERDGGTGVDRRVVEEVLGTAQVTRAFFPDCRDEIDRRVRAHARSVDHIG